MEYVDVYDMIDSIISGIGSDAVDLFFSKNRSYERECAHTHTAKLNLDEELCDNMIDMDRIGHIDPISVHVYGDTYARMVSQPRIIGKRVKHVVVDYELYTKEKKGA